MHNKYYTLLIIIMTPRTGHQSLHGPLLGSVTLATPMATLPRSTAFPKRGSKLCPSCGSSNGNRAYACKACHRRLYADPCRTPSTERSKQWCDVSCMTSRDDHGTHKLYSVRVRECGPDYRTLVATDVSGSWKCHYESCRIAAVAISRNGTEHLKTRNSYVNPHCSV